MADYGQGDGISQPLPPGVQADPTYLAFLRGIGMDQRTAQATALAHIARLNAQYNTAVQREPAQREAAIRQTNAPYSANNDWFSGGRLADVAQRRVESEQRLQDYSGAQAAGISDEQTALQQHLSDLARQNADQIGALQGRHDAFAAQDRYINAVDAANNPTGATTQGYTPTPNPAPLDPAHPTGVALLRTLDPAQLAQFGAWVKASQGAPAATTPTGAGVRVGPGLVRS